MEKIVAATPVYDIHTHLYDPAFKELLLWGIDDLLVYHYLVAEAFRWHALPYEAFWSLTKTDQADLIWSELFVRHSPISEACRGVLTTLNLLGFDAKKRDLTAIRRWFGKQNPEKHLTRCLELARVEKICMTNSPFDDVERVRWEKRFRRDERFVAGLRMDPLLLDWPEAAVRLADWGYETGSDLSDAVFGEVRRFLTDWTRRMQAQYLMVSLPAEFQFPDGSACTRLIEKSVLPHCREFGVPFALMLGVRRAVNPQLRLAGDGVGRSDLRAIENLCAAHPDNKFLVTALSRENQHELCVLARKFRNLHVFGCWWFTNVPCIVEEMTRMRLELLGSSVTPQHSDARVLEQLIYKWAHFRAILARVLTDKYDGLRETGWETAPVEIERDVKELLGGAFQRFCSS
ncbi:MAG TPA: glucuronate isomerase [Verrucomicrobiae bacterium]|nr:glucuronate isomerase [Verrucomicrobiae bacterium]